MNEDTLKAINKFILQSDKRILFIGSSCIGKTHFISYLRSQAKCDPRYYRYLKCMTDIHYTSGPKTKSNGVIIIGVPFDTYRERRKLRRKPPKHTPEEFEQKYIKVIKKLEEENIPHIFIENRNDYPILDKSSFLTMLTGK